MPRRRLLGGRHPPLPITLSRLARARRELMDLGVAFSSRRQCPPIGDRLDPPREFFRSARPRSARRAPLEMSSADCHRSAAARLRCAPVLPCASRVDLFRL